MKVELIDSSNEMVTAIGGEYQTKYDRLFDRAFDHSEIMRLSNGCIHFISPKVGLEECLRVFLAEPKFLNISAKAQAWMDLKTGERTAPDQFASRKSVLKYAFGRFTPYFRLKGK